MISINHKRELDNALKICHHKMAFILAEVLITIGIIGVVAALTLPTLIQNYKKQVTVTSLKKSYAILSQAIQLSKLDNGGNEYWDYTLPAKDFYDKYLKNYLKSTEEVPHKEIIENITYTYLHGAPDIGGLQNESSYTAKLSDGTFICIDGWYNNLNPISRNVIIDINGFKGPNKSGKDVFWFNITSTKGAIFYCHHDYSGATCTDEGSSGYDCGCKIMNDGWQIKKDYPW